MRKTWFPFLIFIWLAIQCTAAEITSLSHVFKLNRGLLDRDEDGFADTVALCIVIPDTPTVYELAAASEIAARANLESLVVDFSLVKTESEFITLSCPVHPILIGSNLGPIKVWAEKKKLGSFSDQKRSGPGFSVLRQRPEWRGPCGRLPGSVTAHGPCLFPSMALFLGNLGS